MHGSDKSRSSGAYAVAIAQLLAAAFTLSLLVRAIADDWTATDTAAKVGIAALVGVGVVLYRRRLGQRLHIASSTVARVVLVAIVIFPAVWFIGVAAGFILDAKSIQILLTVVLAGLVIEAAVAGFRGSARR